MKDQTKASRRVENPPAFPTTAQHNGYPNDMSGPGTGSSPGMTLLDYFAGQALTGLMMLPEAWKASKGKPCSLFTRIAYNMGQQMLDEKAKRDAK